MVKLFENIKSEPRLIAVHQIKEPDEISEVSKADVKKISQALQEQQFNVCLPIVCLTEEEDTYYLLTGSAILKAAKLAELARVWVFLIAATKPDASKVVEQALIQSKFNQQVFDLKDIQKFVDFIDQAEESELTKISGIKEKYAKMIQEKRPFKSAEDIKKLGPKRSLQWLQAYTQAYTSL